MSKLSLYSIFHLNLAYSSLPEEKIGDVIERCYWPLLRLVESIGIGIGIEASAYTLEKIKEVDPTLLEKLKSLIHEKKCVFIGAGYSQLIGPLVPAEVNIQNLKIGNDLYESMLGMKPTVAYVNEQAYSQGLIKHYLEAGYDSIIMEWNNPAKFNHEWKKELGYHPQTAVDNSGNSINIIWNNSVAFQKFQRYASGEIELDEYIVYLRSHVGEHDRFFPLYGSDAEVFDFRAMRYDEEIAIVDSGEWKRIADLFHYLSRDESFSLVFPTDVLDVQNQSNAFKKIHLESPDQPTPVKKRNTYNITRWALTGRDDVQINTDCYKIYNNLMQQRRKGGENTDDVRRLWKELCYLWASDFRTHIEEKRFIAYKKRLDGVLRESEQMVSGQPKRIGESVGGAATNGGTLAPKVVKKGRNIVIDTDRISASFNVQKGLAIDSLIFKDISADSLIGTLQNGFYNDVQFAEDFFSGHTVVNIPMKQKVTDLEHVSVTLPDVSASDEYVALEAQIKTKLGTIHKTIHIYTGENRIDMTYSFDLEQVYPSSFRSCVLTFNPKAFDRQSLYYACHNGGNKKEYFHLKNDFRSGHLLSHLVSAQCALGNTAGLFEIGDDKKTISIVTDMSQVAALPMIDFVNVEKKNYFLRTFYSLGEFDETSLLSEKRKDAKMEFSVTITANPNLTKK